MFPVKPNDTGKLPPLDAPLTVPGTCRKPFSEASELLAMVDRRVEEFVDDLAPRGALSRFLCRRAASLSVRLDLLDRYNAAATAFRVRRAVEQFDLDRQAEVNHLYSWIRSEPATYAQRLRESPEGIDRLVLAWESLRDEIAHPIDPRWNSDHLLLAESLLGRAANEVGDSAFAIATHAYLNNYFPRVEVDREFAPLTNAERQVCARARLAALIEAEIAGLAAERANLDFDTIELDRAEAADRALVDPSPPGVQLRRYEMATERSLHRAIRTMESINKLAEPDPMPAGDPDDLVEAGPPIDPDADPGFGSPSKDTFDQARRYRKAAERAVVRREMEQRGDIRPDWRERFS